MQLNVPLDKLSKSQLTNLINFKMRKSDDIKVAKMKKTELLPIWNKIKDRPDPLFGASPDDNQTLPSMTPSDKAKIAAPEDLQSITANDDDLVAMNETMV